MLRSSEPECNCVQGCLGEAPKPDCVVYASQVVANACTLAKTLFGNRIDVITVGTDTPLIDFSEFSVDMTIGLGCPWGFRLNLQEQFRTSFWCGRQLCPLISQIEKELSHIQPASADKIAGWQVSNEVLITVGNQYGQANLRCFSSDLSSQSNPPIILTLPP